MMTADDVYDGSPRSLQRFYAQSWTLMHFFHVADRVGFPKRRAQLTDYIARLNRGEAPDDACREAFGTDFEALDKEFMQYLAKGVLPYLGVSPERLAVSQQVRTSPLPEPERRYLLGDLALALGDDWRGEAELWFGLAVQAEPGSGRAHAALGRVLPDRDAADAHFARALALAENDPEVQRHYAEAMLARAIAGGGDAPELIERSRRSFRRSIELDPDQVAAYAGLGRSYVVAPALGDPAEGLAALETARERLPADHTIALDRAKLEVEAGSVERARAILARMSLPTHGDPVVTAERAAIAEVRVAAGLPAQPPRSSRQLHTRLDVELPREGEQVRGLSGWVVARGQGGLWESALQDVIIAIDESPSTFLPTGADLDGDGEIGRPPTREPAGAAPRVDRPGRRRDSRGAAGGARADPPARSADDAGRDPDLRRRHQGARAAGLPRRRARVARRVRDPRVSQPHESRGRAGRGARRVLRVSRGATCAGSGRCCCSPTGSPPPPRRSWANSKRSRPPRRWARSAFPCRPSPWAATAIENSDFYRSLAERSGGKFIPLENPADVVNELANIRFTGLEDVRIESSPIGQPGRAVRVFPNGSFDGYVPLAEGKNRITITGRDGERRNAHRDAHRVLRATEQPEPRGRARRQGAAGEPARPQGGDRAAGRDAPRRPVPGAPAHRRGGRSAGAEPPSRADRAMPRPSPRMIRPIALLLTVLTGFSGLVYQVAWQKYLAILLGSHSEAVAAVLAIFLGGLAAGYALFGRVTRRFVERARARGEAPQLLRLYGLVESGIGVVRAALPVPVQPGPGALRPHPARRRGLRASPSTCCLTILLIAPPTVLMGGTIPVLTQALSARLEEATRVHAWVYSFNTAGAFFGALAGAFVLIPWLGLDGVVRAMGLVNLRRRRDLPRARATPAAGAPGPGGRRDRPGRRSASPAMRSSSCWPASR